MAFGPPSQARLAVLAATILPNLTARLSALADRALPSPGSAGESQPGWQARGTFPPAIVTALPDRASRANNEMPQ